MSSYYQQKPSNAQKKTHQCDKSNLLIKEIQNSPINYWQLWHNYEAKLFKYCFYQLTNRNHHDAEDLCRDTLLKSYEKIMSANPDIPFQNWLFKLAKNTFYDQLRKQQTHLNYQASTIEIEAYEEDELFKKTFNKNIVSFIKHSLNHFPKQSADIAIDYFFNEKEYKQISIERNITESQARKIVFNSRNKIKPAVFRLINN
ncbi:sigma-70 family RNA polymerase sigma factor [Pseudoalteromonas umbrosa]|uniref:sigma-70 family RNA polymerase sigma factor n=1 Tax=Pseudoalteromonas umbrosa TaxID=3048489 RepID=UPI0024C3782E|nr:sigma-70 family RNA polymerase sigma factor [Pseudoalteromonas sp. B95]MDK1285745.1 sigma-70 family RNA polymerase sigma factor [Pseudoalteromonas sp. B95]